MNEEKESNVFEDAKEEKEIKEVVIDYKTVLKVGGLIIFGLICYGNGKRAAIKKSEKLVEIAFQTGYGVAIQDTLGIKRGTIKR